MSSTSDPGAVLLVEVDDHVAVVALNRPRVRNALDRELRSALFRAFRELDADPDVAVVVLTGVDPAFCAGIDLKELGAAEGGLGDREGLAISGDARPFPEMSKPVIGAVNGVAVTGGFELALACDFLIASTEARFADTHARVGIQPGWGLTVALPQAVGLRRARELSFTGNYLDATTAYEWGLVNHVVPHDELLTRAVALAHDIAGNDTAGVARIRRTYHEGSLVTGAEAQELEARVSGEWIAAVAGGDVEARRAAVIERGRSQI
jgi:enoyl-CoA hydratase